MSDLPATMTAHELCLLLGISASHYHRHKWRFKDLVQIPAIGRRTRYNRAAAEQFRANTWTHARSFARTNPASKPQPRAPQRSAPAPQPSGELRQFRIGSR